VQFLKIALLVKQADGGYYLDSEYITSCLSLEFLQEKIGRYLTIIKEKLNKFEVVNKQGGIENCYMLNILCAQLQRLYHHINRHPWELFAIIHDYLFTINQEKIHYQHDNLSETFSILFSKLTISLNKITFSSNTCLKFSLQSCGYYVSEALLEKDIVNNNYFLSVDKCSIGEKVINFSVEQIKVASPKAMSELITLALPGLNFIKDDVLSDEKVLFYRLGKQGFYWEKIKEEKLFAMYLPNIFDGMKINIISKKD
jgi:predicted component of type VI protein secretion system